MLLQLLLQKGGFAHAVKRGSLANLNLPRVALSVANLTHSYLQETLEQFALKLKL